MSFDTNLYYLYTKSGRELLNAKTLKTLKTDIKDKISAPEKDKVVFIIECDDIDGFRFNVSQYIITPKLFLKPDPNGSFWTINYTKSDIKNYPFNDDIIKKAINATYKGLIDSNKTSIILNDIL